MIKDSKKSREELLTEITELRLKLKAVEKQRIRSTQIVDTFIENEKYFRTLLENTNEGISIISLEGIFLFFSSSIKQILGYSSNGIIGLNIFDFTHPDDFSILSNMFDKLIKNPDTVQKIELKILHNDKSWRTIECFCKNHVNDPGISGIIMTFRDITEKINYSEHLNNMESQFRSLAENTPVGIFIFSENAILYANNMSEMITGFSKEELFKMSVIDLIHPEYKEVIKKNLESRIRGRSLPKRYEIKIIRKNGSLCWIDYSGSVINFGGKPVILGSVFDITNHKNLELALLDSREHIAVTLNSIADSVISTDENGRIVLLNQEAERTTGWTYSEAFGKPLNDILRFMEDSTHDPETNPIYKVLKKGSKVLLEKYILVSKNGDEIYIEGSCAPIHNTKGEITGIVLAFRDISKRLKMEDDIQRSHKLESIGVLTGGISHDFSNFLTIILGNVILAKMYAKPGDKISVKLTEAERAALRAKELTKKLLNFSTIGLPVKKLDSIEKAIRDSVQLALSGSNIDSEFLIADDLWPIKFDHDQMRQVIINLISNARNVMKKGKKITISASNILLEKDNQYSLTRGKYILISIKDEGPGISEENLKKIFDPYFSTTERDSYKGRGLGLTICYSIIKNHDGFITAESKMKEGSIFHIYLPV
jgi:PAS domain S-box-containing protein